MQHIDRFFELQNQAHREIAEAKRIRESFWGKFPLTKPFVEKRAHAILDGATILVAGSSVVASQLKEMSEKVKSEK